MTSKSEIGGVILAGGRASRMGYCDKALVVLHGRPLLGHVIDKAAPQVSQLLLSVNHNSERYQEFALPLVDDLDRSYAGPLLGILSAMRWFRRSKQHAGIQYLACFPADVPEFPANLVGQLAEQLAKESAEVAYICHRDQIQPLFSLWSLKLEVAIEAAVAAGLYGPRLIFDSLQATALICEGDSPGSFYNINTSQDLDEAMQLIAKN